MSPRLETQSGEIGERVIALEHGIDSLERRLVDRLDNGAERFSAVARQIKELQIATAPKSTDKIKAAGLFLTLAVLFGTWIWQAARYPDRQEYNDLATKVETAQRSVESRIQQLRESQLAQGTELRLMQQRLEALRDNVERVESAVKNQGTRRR